MRAVAWSTSDAPPPDLTFPALDLPGLLRSFHCRATFSRVRRRLLWLIPALLGLGIGGAPGWARAEAIHQAETFPGNRMVSIARAEAKLVPKTEFEAACQCHSSGTSEPGPNDLVWVVGLAGQMDWGDLSAHNFRTSAGYVMVPIIPTHAGASGFTDTWSWPPFFDRLHGRAPY